MDGIDRIREEQLKARIKHPIEHDVEVHSLGALGEAAQGYLDKAMADTIGTQIDEPPWNWPFLPEEWSPRDSAIENLVVAGAYIASEIDRLVWEATNG